MLQYIGPIVIIFKMNYAEIEFLSIPGVIFSPASGGFAPDPHRGSAPGPGLPLLFKLHDI